MAIPKGMLRPDAKVAKPRANETIREISQMTEKKPNGQAARVDRRATAENSPDV
jgi:hypothetical protein